MISPRTAMRLVLGECVALAARRVSIADALGLVVAEDVRARIALPSFDNSSMDGYAVRARDTTRASVRRPATLRIMGSVHAGAPRPRGLRPGEAMGIATGAPLPAGADAVVPFESAQTGDGRLRVVSPVPRWQYVRRRGEEVGVGAVVLPRGSVLHAGAVGSLSAFGCARVRAVPRPRVTVITTGDETVMPGGPLPFGRVYDSNFVMLDALLRQSGIVPARMRHVRDAPAALSRALREALTDSDVVITVGGVSVGRRDYVRDTLRENGVRQVFWRVAQQPGKPLYFGRRGRRLVFGLPGNPVSAFVCFSVYVEPALAVLAGRGAATPRLERRLLGNAVNCDPLRWRLLRARELPDTSRLEVFARQGSHMSTPLALASHLVMVPPRRPGSGRDVLAAGTRVSCIRLAHAREPRR
ncbi:MAG TPA: gephyrin-like molybdotransferase Glp [Candidatus Krumholzibacteria bacterium]|nr:gephyrin-like molybdotransferase Glp [Candidatus Krumholzibacteria bacterium]